MRLLATLNDFSISINIINAMYFTQIPPLQGDISSNFSNIIPDYTVNQNILLIG